MKKFLYFFSAITLVLISSCSNDNSSDTVSSILPKKLKYTEPSYASSNSTSVVVFDGNKIVSVTRKDERTDFIYDGNMVVKITSFDTESGKDVKSAEETYTYANNKLKIYSYAYYFSTQFPYGLYKGRVEFIYNSDGTVKSESYNTDTKTGEEIKSPYVTLITFVNGNLVKEVETNMTGGSNDVFTYLYEYDSKNNPFKNILGFNLLINNLAFCTVNNVVKVTFSNVSGSNTPESSIYKKDYVYDSNGYPTKETSFAKDGTTIEYINEYAY